MGIVIIRTHLTIQLTLTTLELNTYQKKSKIHRKRSMITNIYRIQECDSIVWEYFFNGFMSKSKSMLD